MKKVLPLLFALVAALSARALDPALSVVSKDGTISFTKQLNGFRQPVTVADTTDQPGGSLTLTDAPGTRVIKIERIPYGSTAWAPKPSGAADEPYLKAVMAGVRTRDYPTAKGLVLRSTAHEAIYTYESNSAPFLVVLDHLKKPSATRTPPGPRMIRGYLVFAATRSVVVVQYECEGLTYDGTRREYPSTDFMQWVAKLLIVKDL